MICYALASCFNEKDVNWFFPDSTVNSSTFFAQKPVGRWKLDILFYCNDLQLGRYSGSKNEEHYFYALKLNCGYCFVACDTQLNKQQFDLLFYHLIIQKVSVDDVGNCIEQYTKHKEVAAIQQELDALKEELFKGIDKLLERGDKIENLVRQTQNLPEVSFSFPHREHSDWPPCPII